MNNPTSNRKPSLLKRYWWLVFCFVVPFVIGGTYGWLWLLAEHDIGSQGLHGDEDTKEMREFRKEEPRRFLDYGMKSGVAGVLVALGTMSLAKALRKR